MQGLDQFRSVITYHIVIVIGPYCGRQRARNSNCAAFRKASAKCETATCETAMKQPTMKQP